MRDRLALARRARVSRGGGEGGRGRARVGRGGEGALSDIPHGVEGESLLHASPWRGEGTEKLSDSLPPRGGGGGGGGCPGPVYVCGGRGQERGMREGGMAGAERVREHTPTSPVVWAGEGLLLHDHDRSGTIRPGCVCKLVRNELHEQ